MAFEKVNAVEDATKNDRQINRTMVIILVLQKIQRNKL
jgi:hypothetical protein